MTETRKLEIQAELGVSQPFDVASCRIEEGISETTRAVLELVSSEDLNLESVLAQDARLLLLVEGIVERVWTLKVGASRFLEAKHDALRFSVELFSADHLLRFTRDTRKFRNMSAKEIVSKVLDAGRVTHEWRAARETPRRKYCMQYRESNHDFFRRLLEFEGIYYTFDDEGKMTLADRSSASPEVQGVSHFELHDSTEAMTDGKEGVHELRRGSRIRTGKYTVQDFNWKTPRTNLIQSREAERDQGLEVYEYPAGYRKIPDGEYLAQIRLEAKRVEARYVRGRSSVGRFGPAHVFTFGALGGAELADDYLLTKVTHTYQNPVYLLGGTQAGGKHIYKNEFEAIPREVPFRPAVTTPRPNVDGYHTAMVRGPIGEEIHTDKYGRFRAQFHWDREAKGTDDDSRWLRVVQESASSMFLARVGWEMTVAYIDGDPDRPLGLGRNINRVMPPAYGQPAKKNVMTIKTPTSPATGGFNEIRLDDSAAQQEFYVKAERDFQNIVRNDRSEVVGVNETHTVIAMMQETVERDQRVRVGGNSKTTTGGMHQLRVQNNRVDKVGGNEDLEVGASAGVQVRGHDIENIGSVRLTIAGSVQLPDLAGKAADALKDLLPPSPEEAAKKVGKAALEGFEKGGMDGAIAGAKESIQSMIPKLPTPEGLASQLTGGLSDGITPEKVIDLVCSGSISKSGKQKFTRMVGGAQISGAMGNIATSANYGFTELVGGAKITVAANGDIAQSVMGPLATTVGGALMRTSTEDMSYSAENSFITVGAIASLTSDEKLKIESNGTIELVAQSEMKLDAGGVTITLTPGSIGFTGNLKMASSGKVVVTGKPDNVTK